MKTKKKPNGILVLLIEQGAKLDYARACLESIKKHGIVNARYGCYKIAGRERYIWGNFTGAPYHVLMAVEPTEENTGSKVALHVALHDSFNGWAPEDRDEVSP